MSKENSIYIIGAGVSGLIAAKTLEAQGYSPVLIEASSAVGGRVQTIQHKEHKLDLGFQVLLDAYPAALKQLDYKALNLNKFRPGAVVFKNGKAVKIGDPLRDIGFLIPTLFSGIGTFKDKFKILKLNRLLKAKPLNAIFESPEISTLDYLKHFGFSEGIISDFFKPFFSGIFLEDQLSTSSRMFEFVFKMFAKGNAVLPNNGIQEIPNYLKNQLKTTTFKFNTKVSSVKSNEIHLESGEVIAADQIILAMPPSKIISNLRNQETVWKSCENLYFECKEDVIKSPLIGLIANPNCLINNIFYQDAFKKNKSTSRLLSVTVVKQHNLSDEALIDKVIEELRTECGILDAKFIKRFNIKKALPNLVDLRYEIEPLETEILSNVFVAGDHLLNGSLNAAMISGEKAAEGTLERISGLFK